MLERRQKHLYYACYYALLRYTTLYYARLAHYQGRPDFTAPKPQMANYVTFLLRFYYAFGRVGGREITARHKQPSRRVIWKLQVKENG